MATMESSMSHAERVAFGDVIRDCQADVQILCRPKPLDEASTARFLEVPQAPDVGRVVDSWMRSNNNNNMIMAEPMFVRDRTGLGVEPPVWIHMEQVGPCMEDLFLQQVLHELMTPVMVVIQEISSEDVTFMEQVHTSLANDLAQHGQGLLDQHDQEPLDETHHRLARRLSEVTPADVAQHSSSAYTTPFLPFENNADAQCLFHNSQSVSPTCSAVLNRFWDVRSRAQEARQNQEIMAVEVSFMYAMLLMTVGLVWWRRRHFAVRPAAILRTIYARPHLKQALEKELGHSVGYVPPIMPGYRKLGLMLRTGLLTSLVLWAGGLLSITWFVSLCAWLAMMMFLGTLWLVPTSERECCCCGATPQASKDGLLTNEQLNCGCCQGTGVSCASCDREDDCLVGKRCCEQEKRLSNCCCCCCCGASQEANELTAMQVCCACCKGTGVCESCSCCNGGGQYQLLMEAKEEKVNHDDKAKEVGCCAKKTKKPKMTVFEGVPIQIV